MEIQINVAYITILLTTLLTVWFFYKATKNKKISIGILIWMVITGVLAFIGFYQNTDASPPRFIFLLGPGLLLVLVVTLVKKYNTFINDLDLKWLTVLHIVRIPVEIVLYLVFLDGLVPVLMTFEGWNLDIISGITAPIAYFFIKNKRRTWLLIWNFLCLGLLINILTIAVLSAQTPFQQLAFDQPNIGVAYFPFVWLPAVIVPIVLFSHITSIKKLL
ncbi:hypothetical protein [Aquimarina sp. MMG016]|uniref:hypothetical protein n=1 Tax=Aquimarina sp. MMG016 TaxID=2822690 RepID=UPI001B3A3348|nr:hypothetical protein [Aquimarina sp. MMG016]MBQ4822111.1 hypothetical protein [Aquimarina sp. MMG016]